MGFAIMLVGLIGCVYAGAAIRIAWKNRRYARGIKIAKLTAIGLLIYLGVLLGVSFTSTEKIAGGGEEARLCDLMADCSRRAAVVGVEKRRTLGTPPQEMISDGMYYLVTVKVTSYTQNPSLNPRDLSGVVVDAQDNEYSPFAPGQKYVDNPRGSENPFELRVGPTGGTYKRVLVFDLPRDIEQPALVLQEGSFLEHLVELFVIGDEDSLFHRKTKLLLELPKPPGALRSRFG